MERNVTTTTERAEIAVVVATTAEAEAAEVAVVLVDPRLTMMASLFTIQTLVAVDSSPTEKAAREEEVENVADAATTTTTTTETERATSSVVVDVAAEEEAKVRGLRRLREIRHQCRKTKRRWPLLSRNEAFDPEMESRPTVPSI